MRLLSEKEEDVYLSEKAQLEETIGSRDYDVWICDDCKNVVIYPFEMKDTFTTCAVCGAKAEKKQMKELLEMHHHYMMEH